MSALISPAYAEQITALHARQRWGRAGKGHAPEIRAWASELGARDILDYGCGLGTLKEVMAPFPVAEYDPGIPGKDALPAPADLVVCTDVLEHIEPDRLPAVLNHIRDLSRLGAYFVIGMGAANETLPDGRNAHLIQCPPHWWLKALDGLNWTIAGSQCRKGLKVWIRR